MRAAASLRRDSPASDFADFLEAKAALDERSLNADVRQACIDRLPCLQPVLRWLDAGTGTGAMVCRLLRHGLPPSLSITALDRDAGLLDLASTKLAAQLDQGGYHTRMHGRNIAARKGDHHITISLQCDDLFDLESGGPAEFDLITAHALMDVVPLQSALSRFRNWLAPGGLLYATLTYDGTTALFPPCSDVEFESMLLAQYDDSMEQRRVNGEETGGAHAGRRLQAALLQTRFDLIAYGRCDWNVTPSQGRYQDRDADVLRALLGYIRGEGERASRIDRTRLARWHAEREAAIDTRELGISVHQLDVLARCARGFTPFT